MSPLHFRPSSSSCDPSSDVSPLHFRPSSHDISSSSFDHSSDVSPLHFLSSHEISLCDHSSDISPVDFPPPSSDEIIPSSCDHSRDVSFRPPASHEIIPSSFDHSSDSSPVDFQLLSSNEIEAHSSSIDNLALEDESHLQCDLDSETVKLKENDDFALMNDIDQTNDIPVDSLDLNVNNESGTSELPDYENEPDIDHDSLSGDTDSDKQSRSSDSFKSSSGYDSCNSSEKMGSESLREQLESIVETFNPLLQEKNYVPISEEIIQSLSKFNRMKAGKAKLPVFYGPNTELPQPLFYNAKTMSSSTPMIKKLTEALIASSPCIEEEKDDDELTNSSLAKVNDTVVPVSESNLDQFPSSTPVLSETRLPTPDTDHFLVNDITLKGEDVVVPKIEEAPIPKRIHCNKKIVSKDFISEPKNVQLPTRVGKLISTYKEIDINIKHTNMSHFESYSKKPSFPESFDNHKPKGFSSIRLSTRNAKSLAISTIRASSRNIKSSILGSFNRSTSIDKFSRQLSSPTRINAIDISTPYEVSGPINLSSNPQKSGLVSLQTIKRRKSVEILHETFAVNTCPGGNESDTFTPGLNRSQSGSSFDLSASRYKDFHNSMSSINGSTRPNSRNFGNTVQNAFNFAESKKHSSQSSLSNTGILLDYKDSLRSKLKRKISSVEIGGSMSSRNSNKFLQSHEFSVNGKNQFLKKHILNKLTKKHNGSAGTNDLFNSHKYPNAFEPNFYNIGQEIIAKRSHSSMARSLSSMARSHSSMASIKIDRTVFSKPSKNVERENPSSDRKIPVTAPRLSLASSSKPKILAGVSVDEKQIKLQEELVHCLKQKLNIPDERNESPCYDEGSHTPTPPSPLPAGLECDEKLEVSMNHISRPPTPPTPPPPKKIENPIRSMVFEELVSATALIRKNSETLTEDVTMPKPSMKQLMDKDLDAMFAEETSSNKPVNSAAPEKDNKTIPKKLNPEETEEEQRRKDTELFLKRQEEAREQQRRLQQLIIDKQAEIQKQNKIIAEKAQLEKEKQLKKLEKYFTKKEESKKIVETTEIERVKKFSKTKKDPNKNKVLEIKLKQKREKLMIEKGLADTITDDMSETIEDENHFMINPLLKEDDIVSQDGENIDSDAEDHANDQRLLDDSLDKSNSEEDIVFLPPPENFCDSSVKLPSSINKSNKVSNKRVSFVDDNIESDNSSEEDYAELEYLMGPSTPAFDYENYYGEIAADVDNWSFGRENFTMSARNESSDEDSVDSFDEFSASQYVKRSAGACQIYESSA